MPPMHGVNDLDGSQLGSKSYPACQCKCNYALTRRISTTVMNPTHVKQCHPCGPKLFRLCKKSQVVSPTAKLVGRCRNNRNPDKERDLTLNKAMCVCVHVARKKWRSIPVLAFGMHQNNTKNSPKSQKTRRFRFFGEFLVFWCMPQAKTL